MGKNGLRKIRERLDENDDHIISLSDGLVDALDRLDALEAKAKPRISFDGTDEIEECEHCGGSGVLDSGGQNPDGTWINVPCSCREQPEPEEEWKAVTEECDRWKAAFEELVAWAKTPKWVDKEWLDDLEKKARGE